MSAMFSRLPAAIVAAAVFALLLHGPIPQWADYHDFADQALRFGLPHAADVISNLGFALVGLWGFAALRPRRHDPSLRDGWFGYRLFLLGLLLTAAGSAYYHLAPDNARLVWDRLPIALACAGLLAGVRAELVGPKGAQEAARRDAALLALFAVVSVAWWHFTERSGAGDLRPYVLLQALPLVLIPLWQAIYRAPRRDRLWFGLAITLYVAAKAAELSDHAVADHLIVITGHTLKHLMATAAAAVLVARLIQRLREFPGAAPQPGGNLLHRTKTNDTPSHPAHQRPLSTS